MGVGVWTTLSPSGSAYGLSSKTECIILVFIHLLSIYVRGQRRFWQDFSAVQVCLGIC